MKTRIARKALPLVLLALSLAACAADPGTAGPVGTAPQVDATRLLRHVEVLAADSMRGRRVATEGSAKARRYLLAELRALGLEPVGAGYEHPFTFAANGGAPTAGVNLLARIPGSRSPERILVLTAHYDHLGVGTPVNGDSIYNGADDNASGVAALLEIARWFRENPPQHTLVFALLDAEEGGLRGANALVAGPPFPLASVALNVNLDMVSHSERGELYVAGTSHHPTLRPLLDPVVARAPVRLRYGHDTPVPSPSDDWTLQSDHGAFHEAGIPFLYFGVEDHPDYHRPSDEPRTITPVFFADAARTVLDAVRTLDAAPASALPRRAAGR